MKKLLLFLILTAVTPFIVTANSYSLDLTATNSQYAYILSNLLLDNPSALTICSWYKPKSLPADTFAIFQHGSANSGVSESLAYLNDTGTYKLRGYRIRHGVAANPFYYTIGDTTTIWEHACVTYDGTDWKLYTAVQSGTHAQRATLASSAAAGTQNQTFDGFIVGSADEGDNSVFVPASYFDGLIDEVRVYSAVLTTTDMDTDFEQELVGDEANLVAYYKFENNYEDSDSSGLYDLTSVNTPSFSASVPFSGGGGETATTTALSTADASYTVVLLIIIATVLILDLFRRTIFLEPKNVGV